MFCDIGSWCSNGLPQVSLHGSGVWLLPTTARLEPENGGGKKYLSYTYTIKLGFHGALNGERYICLCVWIYCSSSTKCPSVPRSLELGITPNEVLQKVLFSYIIPVLVWLVPKQCSSGHCGGGTLFYSVFLRQQDFIWRAEGEHLESTSLLLTSKSPLHEHFDAWGDFFPVALKSGFSQFFSQFFTNSKLCIYRLLIVPISLHTKQ